jgi:hypothetical protein
MQVRPTDGTGVDPDQNLAGSRLRLWHINQLQRLPLTLKHHGAHQDNLPQFLFPSNSLESWVW